MQGGGVSVLIIISTYGMSVVFTEYSGFRHDITEILLKVALNIITLTLTLMII